MPPNSRGSIQAIAERILPQSAMELLPFLALAITAGLCEEFLYRGFAMAVLTRLGAVTWAAVLASSVLFGLAHLYQGRGGLVSTTFVGIVLGIGRVVYGSLVPVIFWHAAVDIVAGIAGPRHLLKSSLNYVESIS
jgi:membrane protease YdiL (CAAX protease family)